MLAVFASSLAEPTSDEGVVVNGTGYDPARFVELVQRRVATNQQLRLLQVVNHVLLLILLLILVNLFVNILVIVVAACIFVNLSL